MAYDPNKFKTASPVIATYQAQELLSGTGVIELYPGKTNTTNILTDKVFYSDTIYTELVFAGTGAAALRLDVDFDAIVNRPLTLKGNMLVNVPVKLIRSGSTNTLYVIAKLRKYDGSTETDIATGTSRTFTNDGSSPLEYDLFAIALTVPITSFSLGDTLRLTIEVWGASGANPCTFGFAHDPKGRVPASGWDLTGVIPTTLTAQLPVRIEI